MSVLAVAEHHQGELREGSFRLVTAGRELAAALDCDLHLAVIGGDDEAQAEALDRAGVDTIYRIADGESFNHDRTRQAIVALSAETSPSVLLGLNSVTGLDYMPAVANTLDFTLLTDAVEFDIGDRLSVFREMYGSKVETEIEVEPPVALTIRDAEWEPTDEPGAATIEPFAVEFDETAVRTTVHGYQDATKGGIDISDADVLVSVGRGIDEEENLELIQEFAETLDATVSASRPIIDNGWLPKNRQVGQSGKSVTPEVYFAIGISGAVQHVAGMKGADTIIAINKDSNAPIFDIADYGIVDDLFDVVPALTETLQDA